MNKKSFIEICNDIIQTGADPRITVFLKSGKMIRVQADRKRIFEDFVVFEITVHGAVNDTGYKAVPYESIEEIEY